MYHFIPKGYDSTTISIRLKDDLLERVEHKAAQANLNRTQYIVQCIQFAMAHDEGEKQRDDP